MSTTLDRPKALTPEIQAAIVRMMATGVSLYAACYAAGTTYNAVKYWRGLCDSGAEHAQTYADFFQSIKRAEAISEVSALGTLRQGEQGWQAQAWFLERRFPKRWAAKQKVTAVHSGSIAMTHEQALAELDGPDDADGTTQADPTSG